MILETESANTATKSVSGNAMVQEPTTALFAGMFVTVHIVYENVRCPNITRAKSANLATKTVSGVAQAQETHLERMDATRARKLLLACMIQMWLNNV